MSLQDAELSEDEQDMTQLLQRGSSLKSGSQSPSSGQEGAAIGRAHSLSTLNLSRGKAAAEVRRQLSDTSISVDLWAYVDRLTWAAGSGLAGSPGRGCCSHASQAPGSVDTRCLGGLPRKYITHFYWSG